MTPGAPAREASCGVARRVRACWHHARTRSTILCRVQRIASTVSLYFVLLPGAPNTSGRGPARGSRHAPCFAACPGRSSDIWNVNCIGDGGLSTCRASRGFDPHHQHHPPTTTSITQSSSYSCMRGPVRAVSRVRANGVGEGGRVTRTHTDQSSEAAGNVVPGRWWREAFALVVAYPSNARLQ